MRYSTASEQETAGGVARSRSLESVEAENASLRARLSAMERALERAFELTSGAVVTSSSGLIRCTPEGVVTGWSEGAARIFGWSAAEAVGKPLGALVRPEGSSPADAQGGAQGGAQGALKGEVARGRQIFRGKGEARVDAYLVHTVLRAPQGDPTEIVYRVADFTAPEQAGRTLLEYIELLLSHLDTNECFFFAKDIAGHYLMVNRKLAETWGAPRLTFLGKTDEVLFPGEAAAQVRAQDTEVIARRSPLEWVDLLPVAGEARYHLITKYPLHDAEGEVYGVGGAAFDITDSKRLEAERTELREQVIEAQRSALRELSTPLIPIADGVLVMPLIGTIDSARAAEIMDALLQGVSERSAHTAILDVTGVRVVDTRVAEALVNAARAARLLGARVLLTGLRPDVAQTLVQLGVDLGDVVTLGTLQAGVAHALRAARPRR